MALKEKTLDKLDLKKKKNLENKSIIYLISCLLN